MLMEFMGSYQKKLDRFTLKMTSSLQLLPQFRRLLMELAFMMSTTKSLVFFKSYLTFG
jgi:hypothetical protein